MSRRVRAVVVRSPQRLVYIPDEAEIYDARSGVRIMAGDELREGQVLQVRYANGSAPDSTAERTLEPPVARETPRSIPPPDYRGRYFALMDLLREERELRGRFPESADACIRELHRMAGLWNAEDGRGEGGKARPS